MALKPNDETGLVGDILEVTRAIRWLGSKDAEKYFEDSLEEMKRGLLALEEDNISRMPKPKQDAIARLFGVQDVQELRQTYGRKPDK